VREIKEREMFIKMDIEKLAKWITLLNYRKLCELIKEKVKLF